MVEPSLFDRKVLGSNPGRARPKKRSLCFIPNYSALEMKVKSQSLLEPEIPCYGRCWNEKKTLTKKCPIMPCVGRNLWSHPPRWRFFMTEKFLMGRENLSEKKTTLKNYNLASYLNCLITFHVYFWLNYIHFDIISWTFKTIIVLQ